MTQRHARHALQRPTREMGLFDAARTKVRSWLGQTLVAGEVTRSTMEQAAAEQGRNSMPTTGNTLSAHEAAHTLGTPEWRIAGQGLRTASDRRAAATEARHLANVVGTPEWRARVQGGAAQMHGSPMATEDMPGAHTAPGESTSPPGLFDDMSPVGGDPVPPVLSGRHRQN